MSNPAFSCAINKSNAIHIILDSLLPYFCFGYCNSFCLFSSNVTGNRLFPIAIGIGTLSFHRNNPMKNMAAIILNSRLTRANTKRQKIKQNTSIAKNTTKFKCTAAAWRISISPTNRTNNRGMILFIWISFFLLGYRVLPAYFAPPKRRGRLERLVRNKNHSLNFKVFCSYFTHPHFSV